MRSRDQSPLPRPIFWPRARISAARGRWCAGEVRGDDRSVERCCWLGRLSVSCPPWVCGLRAHPCSCWPCDTPRLVGITGVLRCSLRLELVYCDSTLHVSPTPALRMLSTGCDAISGYALRLRATAARSVAIRRPSPGRSAMPRQPLDRYWSGDRGFGRASRLRAAAQPAGI
jgi:hypothetical protein